MRFQRSQIGAGQRPSIGGSCVLPCMMVFAHASNHRRDGRVAQTEPQGGLGECVALLAKQERQPLSPLRNLAAAITEK